MYLDFSLTKPNTRWSEFTLQVTYERNGQSYYQTLNFDEEFLWAGDHGAFTVLGYTQSDDPSIRFRNNDDGIFQSSEAIHIRPLLELNGDSRIPEATHIDVTLLYDGNELDIDPGSERYPDLTPGASAYPENNDYFWIRSDDCRFTGTVYLDVQIEYDEGTTVVIP